MTVETKEITSSKTIYTAEDGTKFDNETSCRRYEWECTAKEVYIVVRRGQRTELAEVYSTLELAKQAAKLILTNDYLITKTFVNSRLWDRLQ